MMRTCGEATIELLHAYGVDTVFGIPGVHTLDFCRGLNQGSVRHIQVRNEQGAGFMADGYARASGRPGVALVISGPGVTNTLTAIGQAYADSIPVLLISADAASHTLGKGWGSLHEVSSLTDVTAPLTAFSATARQPEDVPEFLARAFTVFTSERPRPVHIAIPIDVLAMQVRDEWKIRQLPSRLKVAEAELKAAAETLGRAERPLIYVGGGAAHAAAEITRLAERLNAAVISTTSGKGIVPDTHPLSLGSYSIRGASNEFIASRDVVLAIGTEMSEVDNFEERMRFNGYLIRVDIDRGKMNDEFPADLPLVCDAKDAAGGILAHLEPKPNAVNPATEIAEVKAFINNNLNHSEKQHIKALDIIRAALPEDAMVLGDACQIVYTGSFAFNCLQPGTWHFPGGFCTLGSALPDAIGAKLAQPERAIIAIAGDGGFMFTCQELVTAAELNLPLPIILWNNNGLKQIQDNMRESGIDLVGVEGTNPDFQQLAAACGCHTLRSDSAESFHEAITTALGADKPTLIEILEDSDWLL